MAGQRDRGGRGGLWSHSVGVRVHVDTELLQPRANDRDCGSLASQHRARRRGRRPDAGTSVCSEPRLSQKAASTGACSMHAGTSSLSKRGNIDVPSLSRSVRKNKSMSLDFLRNSLEGNDRESGARAKTTPRRLSSLLLFPTRQFVTYWGSLLSY